MPKKRIIKKIEKKSKNKKINSDKDGKILFAFLATFLSIIGFLIALIAKRENEYVMHYAKQSLVIFVIGALAGITGNLFNIFPIIGAIINFALGIIVIVLWIMSWVYALSNEEKTIPVVSYWADKIKL